MGAPGTYGMTLYQGDRFELLVRVREADDTGTVGEYVDLTDKIPKSVIKSAKGGATVATFTCELTDQLAIPGGLKMILTPAITSQIAEGNYVYDLQITTDPEHVTTYLAGSVVVIGEVTENA